MKGFIKEKDLAKKRIVVERDGLRLCELSILAIYHTMQMRSDDEWLFELKGDRLVEKHTPA